MRAWLLLAAGLLPSAAQAHALTEATARLTLRDGHFDVALEADLFALVSEGPTQVATATDDALAAAVSAVRGQLESGAQLSVDGAPVPLRLLSFPSPQEFRAVAAVLSASGRTHGELIRVGLDAAARSPGARTVSLALPPALGPVVVSFVEPQAAYVQPGGRAQFRVRGAADPESSVRPEALVAGTAGLLLLAWVFRRKLGGNA